MASNAKLPISNKGQDKDAHKVEMANVSKDANLQGVQQTVSDNAIETNTVMPTPSDTEELVAAPATETKEMIARSHCDPPLIDPTPLSAAEVQRYIQLIADYKRGAASAMTNNDHKELHHLLSRIFPLAPPKLEVIIAAYKATAVIIDATDFKIFKDWEISRDQVYNESQSPAADDQPATTPQSGTTTSTRIPVTCDRGSSRNPTLVAVPAYPGPYPPYSEVARYCKMEEWFYHRLCRQHSSLAFPKHPPPGFTEEDRLFAVQLRNHWLAARPWPYAEYPLDTLTPPSRRL